MQIDSAEFYEQHWRARGGALSHDEVKRDQIRRIVQMIPDDVRTILDVGCGDGAISNVLAEKFTVTAVDRSAEALTHLSANVKGLEADATHLPFDDGGFDLVLSSEMIEHLPNSTLAGVVTELKRVAAKYIVISVPNDEKLRKRYTKCSRCGHEFHIYLHFQSFNRRRLQSLFAPWEKRAEDVCGAIETPSINWIRYLLNRLGGTYFYLPEVKLVCPSCGAMLQRLKRSLLHRVTGRMLMLLESGLVALSGRRPAPDWLMMAFARPVGGGSQRPSRGRSQRPNV